MRLVVSIALSAILLYLPYTASAQEAAERQPPQLAVGIHGNTGSAMLLGVSYFFNQDIVLRTSAGFYPEDGRYDIAVGDAAERVTYDTQWYSTAVAGLYYLPSLWRFHPYTGLKAQYTYATTETSTGHEQASDRVDAGGLAGLEVGVFSWLRFSGEVGVGYRSGLNKNHGIVTDDFFGIREGSEFGLTHAGLGFQIRLR